MASLSPHFIELIRDALLKSFWWKNSLIKFLRRMHIAENTLASFREDETKRMFLDRLFPPLESHPKGPALLNDIARALADQETFPDFINVENSAKKIEDAKAAVAALRNYLNKKSKEKDDEESAADKRRVAKDTQNSALRSQTELLALKNRLDKLAVHLGKQQAGYDFQTWFYDLMTHFEVDTRRPYVADGRQIDGSVTVDGTTYLVELKFTKEQSGATDIDSLVAKVNSKADNTMGIMVSISGYSSVAIDGASIAKSPLLLIDYSHLYHVLMGNGTFAEVVTRIRRHSAQEGKAFLPVSKFGG